MIFVSYRRSDSADAAGRLYDRLEARLGRDNVFMDDSIPLGVDFRQYLNDAVGRCGVLLAVIGDRWLEARFEDGPNQGQRRLEDPRDFVRIEIEAALARGIPVVPVLVGRASMPREENLPDGLKELTYRNATELRAGPDFPAQVDRLIRGIERLLQPREVEVSILGEWYARSSDEPSAEWTLVRETAGVVTLRAGERYRLDVVSHVTDQQLSGLADLQGLTGLQELNLWGCVQVTDAGLAHLRGLTGLRQLDLAGCVQVTDAGLAQLRGLTGLQLLYLSLCGRVTDAGLAHLGGLTGLQLLDLEQCKQVTDAGLAHLRGLTGLQQLDLTECKQVTDAGKKALRAALPGCTIG
jgi:hypothetical protein